MIERKRRRRTSRTFYLEWRENGKSHTRPVGIPPCEAFDAWLFQSGILWGEIEAPEELPAVGSSTEVHAAIEICLAGVRVAKGEAAWRAYSSDIAWFEALCGEKPDAHFLELGKEIAYRAGLNCKRCKTQQGKCSDGPHCRKFYLHKWRHTFATQMLQSVIDINCCLSSM